MISEKDLRAAAEAVGEAMLSQLPPPSECDHVFSERFEEQMAPVLAEAAKREKQENDVRIQSSETFKGSERTGRMIRMSRKRILILVAVIAALFGLVLYAVADDLPFIQQIGKSVREQMDKSDDTKVIASFREFDFTEKDINVRLEMNLISGGELAEKDTTKEVVEQLVLGKLLVAEAEKQGVAATEAEIESFISDQKERYSTVPEVKEYLDEYCAGAGYTIDEYWALIEESAPDIVSKNKLLTAVAEAYLAEHPDEESYNNPELSAYLNDYRGQLLEQHRDEIIYH